MKILVLVVVKIICKKIEYFVFSNFYTFYKFLSILVILDLSEFFIWKKFLYFFWKIVFVFIFFGEIFWTFIKKTFVMAKNLDKNWKFRQQNFWHFFVIWRIKKFDKKITPICLHLDETEITSKMRLEVFCGEFFSWLIVWFWKERGFFIIEIDLKKNLR